MLAIANSLEDRGADVSFGGGGTGAEFVALNGYDAVKPTTVDFIDTYQDGSLWQSIRHSVPASLGRIADCQAWFASTDPDAVVTDDMFAAMAAARCDIPLYVLKHDMPGLYHDPVERSGTRFHTLFQLSAAREFFYPVVWPGSAADPDRATRIPPVALDGDRAVRGEFDVVVVPSHYSSLDRVADHLRRQGYDVLNMADDDWDAVANPPDAPTFGNGADVVARRVLADVRDPDPYGTPAGDTDDGPTSKEATAGHGVRAVPTLLAVGLLTVGNSVHPVRVVSGFQSRVRQTGQRIHSTLSRGYRAASSAAMSGRAWLSGAASRLRGAARRIGRGVAAPF